MELLLAGIVALFAFIAAIAVPLAARDWRRLGLVTAAGIGLLVWINAEIGTPGTIPAAIGPFAAGLMLFGFAAGVVARAVMLLGQRR